MTEDFKSRIKKDFLPFMIKPGRYIGNEWGVVKKDSEGKFRVALVYPDIYERAVSNPDFNWVYYFVNQNPHWIGERVFLPAKDAEKLLRESRHCLFSLENFIPLKEFDILIFALRDELHFTLVLNMLDLAEIPIYAKERLEKYPLVAGYGRSALNPEPLADFFDFFILGDETEIIKEIFVEFEKAKKDDLSKEKLLKSLSEIHNIYAPALYEVKNCNKSPKPKSKEIPYPISVKLAKNEAYYIEKKIVPLVETERGGLEIEVSGGSILPEDFPVNEKKIDEIVKEIQIDLDNTGQEEVSIKIPSDYENFYLLLKTLWESFGDERVSFYFPALNPARVTPEVIKLLSEQKRNHISFSRLGISDRLRNFLNQNISSSRNLEVV